MGVKRIQISDDNGSNWYTLPGNSGELTTEGNSIDDTIFGQNWKSMQPGLIQAGLSANGLYKGFAGYVATLKKTGTPTTMTAEATTFVSGKTYQITDTTKRAIDPDTAVSVYGNAILIAASNIESIDYLWGKVTFKSAYTPTTPITITGKYLPLSAVARATGFTLTQQTDPVDDTDFATAQANGGYRAYLAGLKTVSLALNGIMATTNDWRSLLLNRTRVLIEICPDGANKSVARGFFRTTNVGQSGNVGAQEAASATFPLSVPDVALMLTPFSWVHDATSTLNTALQKALTAWSTDTAVDLQYLFDGTNGYTGDAILTDVSLAGGLEVMNEFAIKANFSGALTAVP
jgi:predicted secreted protein